ncbi:YitT family protein [Cryobacterium arcticum]|uniref:YitT family protein n=1 Tax=Cryobacterium arcticum TaxID=670052 RepID=UPI002006FCAD|nr:YitT family protein [Cryobacterium arcticum]
MTRTVPAPIVDPSEGPQRVPHSRFENIVALFIGTFAVSFGLYLLKEVGVATGGTAGIALLASYVSGWSFSVWFVLVNIPFFVLAIRRMGWRFTLKTLAAVVMVSLFSEVHPLLLEIRHMDPVYATILGSLLAGIGLIVLFRHQASLGGVNILALYLQQSRGWRAGYVQLVVDVLIVLAAFATLPVPMVLLSVVGAVILNMIIAMNHRPDRYFG